MPKQFQPQSFSYSVCAKIGEGLHSEVYKVMKVDLKHNLSQIMALKILKSKVLADIWKREFENLSKISSNYCVRILGWEWISARPALVLEYIEGTSLQSLLDLGSLSIFEINLICTQLYWGLKDLQKFGVAHGDLNPHNILFTLQGDLKFIDFGVQGENLEVLYTSPKFCAPELFYEKNPSYESDLYSLAILRQLLLQSSGLDLAGEDLNTFKLLTSSNPQNRNKAFLKVKNPLHIWSYSDEDVDSLCKKILFLSLREQKNQEKTKEIKSLNRFTLSNKKKWLQPSFFWKKLFSAKLSAAKSFSTKLSVKKLFSAQSLKLIFTFLLAKTSKKHLFLFVFLLTFTSSSLDRILFVTKPYSQLSVLTRDWKKLFIDEVFVGYTPIYSLSLKEGWHKIQWKSDKSEGHAYFFISQKYPLVLKSDFFKR